MADPIEQRAELIRRAQAACHRTLLALDADLAPLGTTIACIRAAGRDEIAIIEASIVRGQVADA